MAHRGFSFMRTFLLLLLCIFSACIPPANAAGFDAILGVGIGKDVIGSKPFERYGALGVQYGGMTWKVRANGGYWLALAEGEKASAFTSLQGGLEVVGQGGIFCSVFFGPAYISQPDDKRLSGHLQFHLDPGCGVRSAGGYSIMGRWTHFSNAGLKQPNGGRDMPGIAVQIPIGWSFRHLSNPGL